MPKEFHHLSVDTSVAELKGVADGASLKIYGVVSCFSRCGNSSNLTAPDVRGNTLCANLICVDNMLPSLDVSEDTARTELACYKVPLTALDVSHNSQLHLLNYSDTRLTAQAYWKIVIYGANVRNVQVL